MQETKEEIKNRMIRSAAKIWGYPEIASEDDFDPLVSLLLNVNAAEFERLANQSADSKARILERMIQIMTPEILISALPAHAVVHAVSASTRDTVGTQEQLLFSDPGDSNRTQFFFAPAGQTTLSSHTVKFVATRHYLFEYKSVTLKEVAGYSPQTTTIEHHSIWIGLSDADSPPRELQFFFQAEMLSDKDIFYNQLAKAKWTNAAGQPIIATPGYNNKLLNENRLDVEQILKQDVSVNSTVLKDVTRLYRHRFVTVTDPFQQGQNEVPEELRISFPDAVPTVFQRSDIYWVKVSFPENIHYQLLQEVNYYANCFPVVNKRMHETIHELKELINIIPLATDSHFFDLEEVMTREGERLDVRNIKKKPDKSLHVTLRNGGVARFDDRDASAAIDNVIQLLRNDSAAFSAIGKNFISHEMKQLHQIINRLTQHLMQKNISYTQSPHLIIKGEEKNKTQPIFVKYWSTEGVQANGIKPGTPLATYKSSSISYHNAYFVTASAGGRNALNATDKVTAYKHALLSKNRIISKEDIHLFCRLTFGDGLKEVIIRGGVMVPADFNKGYMKTLDITLIMYRQAYLSIVQNMELEYWKEYLQQQLSGRSQSLIPYRIFIKDE